MENSKIEWTDHTFNPWIGCTRVSPGCQHCYAETMMDKRYGKVKWGPQGLRVRTSADYWRQPLKWNREAAKAGERRRVFCASLADVFEDKPDQRKEMDEWRDSLFHFPRLYRNLDWLFLTKRPENIMEMVHPLWLERGNPPNVWIGTSVETQEYADKRIPELLKIPAAVRFLSVEPMLGPIDIWKSVGKAEERDDVQAAMDEHWHRGDTHIHWIIVGGESGPDARPMHPEWVRSIRDQCQDAGVPFLFKQWGEWLPYEEYQAPFWITPDGNLHDGHALNILDPLTGDVSSGWDDGMWAIEQNLSSCAFRKVGKHRAGRLLDGREWNEFPQSRGD